MPVGTPSTSGWGHSDDYIDDDDDDEDELIKDQVIHTQPGIHVFFTVTSAKGLSENETPPKKKMHENV